LVCLVYLVERNQLDEQNKPDQPDEPINQVSLQPEPGAFSLKAFSLNPWVTLRDVPYE
jgi:hypothetical protein